MSVTDYNLVADKPTMAHRVAEDSDYAAARQKTYNRDIFKRTRTKDLCGLVRQLATLLRAGMPLVPALSALVEQLQETPRRKIMRRGSRSDSLAQIIRQVADDVNGGSTLADALRKYPAVFSDLFVNMVAAGQASGTLEEILRRLAEIMEKRLRLAGRVSSAIAYPLMMIVVASGVVVFLLSFVVPGITQIFIEMNRHLPWPTSLLISISNFINSYFLLIAVMVCAGLFGIGVGCRTKEGKLLVDRWKLKLPLFGRLFLKLEIARLARTLGTLLAGGIPILAALEIAKGIVQNSFIADALGSVKDSVGSGDNIARAIKKTGIFPPIVFHIIATCQISGDMESGLINIADMYDDEVETTAKTLTSLLEPAILLAMGIVVGFIVLAILLPIFEINQVL